MNQVRPVDSHWPKPVNSLSADVVETRRSIRVPEGEVFFDMRTLRGSSAVWLTTPHGAVLKGSTLADALRKLGAYMGYGLGDIVPGLES